MKDRHSDAFLVEARELLEVLETSLLELENNPADDELIGKIFRALHTLKGSGGMFGYENLAGFIHNIETVFDRIRNREIEVKPEIIELTLRSKDFAGGLIYNGDKSFEPGPASDILKGFSRYLNNDENNDVTREADDHAQTDSELKQFKIKFVPSEDIFLKGVRPLGLLKELAELGTAEILPITDRIPLLDEFNPEKMYLSWEIKLLTSRGINAIKDVFIFVEDDCTIEIEETDLNNEYRSETAAELKSEHAVKGEKKQHKSAQSEIVSSIRVSSDKLDQLVNLVGELVTVQARLAQNALKKNDPEILLISEVVERLTWELRESALSIRMLPIGSTFNKFNRLIRDLSKELGKEVELITQGGDTELDKNVLEKLNDPLVHILRNCIDHGIESPEERTEKGKPASGRITLSALHSGTHVLIKISDDGAGLNLEAIRYKAVERGLIREDAQLKEEEIFKLIFEPGFSTAQAVTNVSGRGVGMDVVRSAIDSLRGTVSVESRAGSGTTITLKLPLTLAIIEGLIVKISEDYFVIPLSFVEECIELPQEKKNSADRKQLVNVRNEIVPYIYLRHVFGIDSVSDSSEQIIILNENGVKTGFVVDEVIGQHQTVIKTLGTYYKNIEIISGATVLGDGTVALIIDVQKLNGWVEREENKQIL